MVSLSLTEDPRTDGDLLVQCATTLHKGTDHLRDLLHSHKAMLLQMLQQDLKTPANLVRTSEVDGVEDIIHTDDSGDVFRRQTFVNMTSNRSMRR